MNVRMLSNSFEHDDPCWPDMYMPDNPMYNVPECDVIEHVWEISKVRVVGFRRVDTFCNPDKWVLAKDGFVEYKEDAEWERYNPGDLVPSFIWASLTRPDVLGRCNATLIREANSIGLDGLLPEYNSTIVIDHDLIFERFVQTALVTSAVTLQRLGIREYLGSSPLICA